MTRGATSEGSSEYCPKYQPRSFAILSSTEKAVTLASPHSGGVLTRTSSPRARRRENYLGVERYFTVSSSMHSFTTGGTYVPLLVLTSAALTLPSSPGSTRVTLPSGQHLRREFSSTTRTRSPSETLPASFHTLTAFC